MHRKLYILFYIDREYPDNSDILGIYTSKSDAVAACISKAGYTYSPQSDSLYQFGDKVDVTYDKLHARIEENMSLTDSDEDVYRIVCYPLSE